ncbi:MAG: PEGA domain-containing protein [Candidatus Daviesbacteria bacterium]|nr:PEGA domain-containing protein [Candidatus Daviesbacteria bacterium]
MKKKIFVILIVLSVLALLFRFGVPMLASLWENPKSGLQISSTPEADVLFDGQPVGRTPYENNDLKVRDYKITLKAGESIWQGMIPTTAGTVSILNRDLAPNIASSSGEALVLRKGKGVFLTSTPSETEIEINGKVYGKTPLLISDLAPAEYVFLLSHSGYNKRQIRVVLPPQMQLNINTDLAVTEVDLGVSSNIPKVSSETKVTVKQTPTGFLRVRNKPSTTGKELARVSAGDSLILLEEGTWDKIRTTDGIEGYVSGVYIIK